MKIINTEKKIIKSWCNEPEDGAIDQAKNLANLPFAFKHIALMPDCHSGYGMPIGGVLATKGVIIPNAVGVDIGCGMCAVKTSLTEISQENLKIILGEIRKAIPVGFNKHKEIQSEHEIETELENIPEICMQEWDNASKSIGTLGGGNHFIEIQKGSDGFIYIMIHSGSRNLGKQVAGYYNKVAINLCGQYFQEDIIKQELAFLPINSEEGRAYLREMNYCVDYALANRKLMMDRVLEAFKKFIIIKTPAMGATKVGEISGTREIRFEPMINIAHNYARLENHYGENVWVHRKGATSARKGEIGIIPGSQGTSSYIVEGLGNEESFMSCSHGAGRKMSRTRAQNELNLAEEQKKLDDKCILHAIRGKKDLDEASGSYKDIDVVMEEQKDLVKILIKLEPLAVIKG